MPHTNFGNDFGKASGGALLSGALRRLLEILEMPVTEADWRNLGPGPEEAHDLATAKRLSDRLGLSLTDKRATGWRLRRESAPFLILGYNPDEIWVVRGRTGRDLVLVSPDDGTVEVQPLRTLVSKARRIVRLAPQVKSENDRSWHGVVKKQLRPILWQVGLASVVINLLALATPLFMMTVYNKVVSHGALATLDVMVIGMISLLVFELILRSVRGTIAARTGAKLDAALGSEVVHHLLSLPNRMFEKMPTGQTMERVRQLDSLRQFLAGQLPLLLVDLLFVGLFVAVIFMISPVIGWITLAAMPAFLLISWIAHGRQKQLIRKSFLESSNKASALSEIVGQSFTIKALGLEAEMERRFDRSLITTAYCGYRASALGNLVGSLGLTLQHAAALLLVYVGARMIIAGDLTVGGLIACSILAARAIAPMRQLFSAWHQLEQTRHAFNRLESLMKEPSEFNRPGARAEIELVGRIKFDNVSYRYGRSKNPALSDLSFELEPGTMLGVTGLPGSGKSTLTRLLIGLDRPEGGQIEIDGLDLTQLSPASYRQQIGVVPQEIELFRGTIADNIALAADDGSLQRIVAAAKFVGAHDFIQALDNGYDTELAERGAGLSLGQRQLISIARALIKNPRILVLDEATSALDAVTEANLLINLRRAGRGRTIIIVSHKQSVLMACDQVLILDGGRLRKISSPDECAELIQPASERALQTVGAAG